MPHLLLLAALAVGGCSAATLPAAPADHPASVSASAAPADTDRIAFAPADQPVLPPALQPAAAPAAPSSGAMAGMEHGAAHPAAHAATATAAASTAAATVPGLTATLDAYLAVHDALAGDRFADAAAQAKALETAFGALVATPPPGDEHLWHRHADDLASIRTQITALAGAADIAAARVAFGTMSVPFIRLVQATGVPAGYDLALMRCGMARGVPDGGVWVQRAGETANPFFGASMLRCGSRTGAIAPPNEPVGR